MGDLPQGLSSQFEKATSVVDLDCEEGNRNVVDGKSIQNFGNVQIPLTDMSKGLIGYDSIDDPLNPLYVWHSWKALELALTAFTEIGQHGRSTYCWLLWRSYQL
jgi:hypothetical protein